jgi:hypothetical protein
MTLFKPLLDASRFHPSFAKVATAPGSEPARTLMAAIFDEYKKLADAHFVEEFQGSGFDARVFELYMYAYLASDRQRHQRARPRGRDRLRGPYRRR